MQIPIFRGGGCVKKVKLGEICEIQAGGTPSRNKQEFWVQGNIPWVKIKDINSKYISKVEEHITDLGLRFSSAKLFSRGTILYTIFATIGEVAILDIDAATNQAIAGLHLKSEKVLKEYLYFFLLSIKNRVKNDSRGVAQNNINLTYLKNIEVPIVENSIQQEICNNLTKINQIITLRNQQLIELSNLVKSRFNEMFGDISKFDVERLNNSVKEMFIGPFGSSLKNDYFVSKEKAYCMVYEQKHAIKKTMNLETRYVDEKKYKELKRFSIYGGDIIVSCRGTIGEIFQVPNNAPLGIMHPSIMKIRLDNSKYNPIFFKFMLSDYMDIEKIKSKGSGVKMAITASELGKIGFPLPPLSLQNEFADFVAQVDKSQFACQMAIKLWRNSLKSSII